MYLSKFIKVLSIMLLFIFKLKHAVSKMSAPATFNMVYMSCLMILIASQDNFPPTIPKNKITSTTIQVMVLMYRADENIAEDLWKPLCS